MEKHLYGDNYCTEIDDGIYYFKCPFNNGQSWTGVGLIYTGKKYILIDSGDKGSIKKILLPWLDKKGIEIKDISMLINTHTHGDHIQGNKDLKHLNNKIIFAAHELAKEKLENPIEASKKIRGKFSKIIETPEPSKVMSVELNYPLKDNQEIKVDNSTFKIIYTPGHDSDCICIYDRKRKTLFSGDSLLGGGGMSSGIAFYQDLQAYRNSLKKVNSLEIDCLVLGHAFYPEEGIIKNKENVKNFLGLCMDYTYRYEEEILRIINDGSRDLVNIAKELIKRSSFYKNPSQLFMPLYTVRTHLIHLNSLGEIHTDIIEDIYQRKLVFSDILFI